MSLVTDRCSVRVNDVVPDRRGEEGAEPSRKAKLSIHQPTYVLTLTCGHELRAVTEIIYCKYLCCDLKKLTRTPAASQRVTSAHRECLNQTSHTAIHPAVP